MSLDDRQLTLPIFDGETPIGTEASFAGKVDVRTGAYGYEPVFWLVSGGITEVNHKKGGNGVMRAHKVAVTEAYPVDHEVAREWLAELSEQHRQRLDAFLGRESLFDGDGTPVESDTDVDAPASVDA